MSYVTGMSYNCLCFETQGPEVKQKHMSIMRQDGKNIWNNYGLNMASENWREVKLYNDSVYFHAYRHATSTLLAPPKSLKYSTPPKMKNMEPEQWWFPLWDIQWDYFGVLHVFIWVLLIPPQFAHLIS